MSYASVAAHNAPPASEQPQPDPSLLSTAPSTLPDVADETSKVNVVPTDFKEHPTTVTSEFSHNASSPPPNDGFDKSKAKKDLAAVEAEGVHLWDKLKDIILRPPVAGGLIGFINVGLLASAAYAFYTQPRLQRDTKAIASTVVGTLAIVGVEGYGAEAYLKTPSGQEEERRAKAKGSLIYRHTREHILRPGVLGGLVGLVNVGVLSTVGYFAYANWDRPQWDRRAVSAVSIGLLSLWGSEGYLAAREDVQKQFRK